MAILHIDRRRRPLLLAGAVAASLGAGLLAVFAWFGKAPPTQTDASSVEGPHFSGARIGAQRRQSEAPLDSAAGAAPDPLAESSSDADQAARLYRQALLYLDCQTMAESSADFTPAAPEQSYLFDPSGGLAANIEREAQARREPCRSLGPSEYRQVASLMQRAAQLGDRDARFFLLDREVRTAIDRAATAHEQGRPASGSEMGTLWREVQALAAGGHRDAMVLAGQLLAAGHVGAPAPVQAAAWNLVALQLDRGVQLAQSDLAESGVLASLTDEESAQALHDAELLRRACCQR